jgi:hypothetical protein
MIKRVVLVVILLVAVAGCAPAPNPAPPLETRHVDGAAVERRPLPNSPAPATVPVVPGGAPPPATQPVIVVPPNTLYVCVVDVGGVRKQTAIEFAPKVGELCAKHPEMSPCQYERNACRHNGGRVYAANGMEITMATEAEYDKKVMRVQFKGG